MHQPSNMGQHQNITKPRLSVSACKDITSLYELAQLGQTLLAVTQSAARNHFQPFQDRQQSVVRHKQANEGLVLYVST